MIAGLAAAAALAVAVVCLTFGCGGGGTIDPAKALKDGKYQEAAEAFQKQVDAAKPVEDPWVKAKLGHIEAVAHIDVQKAEEEARALLRDHGKELGDRRACAVAGALANAGAHDQALNLLKWTVEMWPESLELDTTHDRIFQNRVKVSGTKGLEGLGYVGTESGAFKPRPDTKTPPEKFPKP